MEDPISAARRQLRSFRIKELKEVLGALGLGRQGKKQALFDKVEVLLRPRGTSGGGSPDHTSLSPDLVADAIHEVYSAMQGQPATAEEHELEDPLQRHSSMEEAAHGVPPDHPYWGGASSRGYPGHTAGASGGAGAEREAWEGTGAAPFGDNAPLRSFLFEHRGGQGGAVSNDPYSLNQLDPPSHNPRHPSSYTQSHSQSHSHSHSHRHGGQDPSRGGAGYSAQAGRGEEDPAARQPLKFRIPNPHYSRRTSSQQSPPVQPQPPSHSHSHSHSRSPHLQSHSQQQQLQLNSRGHLVSPASATKGAPRSRKGVSASPGSGGKRGPRDVKAVYGPQARVQCVCGRNTWAEGEALVPCNGGCGVLEHSACVLIPPEKEKGKEERPKSLSEMAAEYFCELCRLARGDPYLVTVSSPVPPTRLHKEYGGGMDSARQLVALSGFRIPKADMDLIARPDYLLQVWCMQLNDRTPNRIHWPAYPEMQINGRHLQVIRRPGQQLLGANGRDEGHAVGDMVHESGNYVHFRCQDARPFCVGLRVARCRMYEEVLALVPPLDEGETLDEAIRRVERCVGAGQPNGKAGGGDGDAASEDSDDVVVMAEAVTLKLADPNSGLRIQQAGRFRECAHMGCFDLPTLVQMNRRAKKWQCPVCMRLYTVGSLVVDAFFERVCRAMAAMGLDDEIKDVELKSGGFWRPKAASRPGKGPPKTFEWRDVRQPLSPHTREAPGAPEGGAADEADSAATAAARSSQPRRSPPGAPVVAAKPEPWAGGAAEGAPPNGTAGGVLSLPGTRGAGHDERGPNGAGAAGVDAAAYKRRRVEAGDRGAQNHNHSHSRSHNTGDGYRGSTPPLGQWLGSGGRGEEGWTWGSTGAAPGRGGGGGGGGANVRSGQSGGGSGLRGNGGLGSMRRESEGREDAPIVLSDSDDDDGDDNGFAAPIAPTRVAPAPVPPPSGLWGPYPGASLSQRGRGGWGNESQPISLSPEPPRYNRVPSQQTLSSEENVPLALSSRGPFSPTHSLGGGTPPPGHSNGHSPLASPPAQSQRSRFQGAPSQGQGAPPGARQVHRSFSPLPAWGTTGGRHTGGRGERAQGAPAGVAYPVSARDGSQGGGRGDPGGASGMHREGDQGGAGLAQWLAGRDSGRAGGGGEAQAESSGQTRPGFPPNAFDRAVGGAGAGTETGGSQSQSQFQSQSQPQPQSQAQGSVHRGGGTYTPALGRSLSLRLGQSFQSSELTAYPESTGTHPGEASGGDAGAAGHPEQGSSGMWGFAGSALATAGAPVAPQEASGHHQQRQQGQQGRQTQGQQGHSQPGQQEQGQQVQGQGQGMRAEQEGEALDGEDADDLLGSLSWGRWASGSQRRHARRHQRVVTDDTPDEGALGEAEGGGYPVRHDAPAAGGVVAEVGGGDGSEGGALGAGGVPQGDLGPGGGGGVVADSEGWVHVRPAASAPQHGSGAPRADQGAAGRAGLAGGSGAVPGTAEGLAGLGAGRGEGNEGGEGGDFDAALDAMLMRAGGAVAGGEEGGHVGGQGEQAKGGGGPPEGGLEAHRPGSRGRTPSLNWDEHEAALLLTAEDLDDLGEPPAPNGHAGGLSADDLDDLGESLAENGPTGGGAGEVEGAGGGFADEEGGFWLSSDGNASGAFGQQRNWLHAHQAEQT